MPTRPQAWRFRAIYEDFEHEGLRTAVDRDASTPLDRVGRVIRVGGPIVDSEGHVVGNFTRMLASGADGVRARHEHLELDEAARGRGFARALHAHAEAVYVRMGIAYVTMHAEHVGSLLWPRLGFDFDLRRIDGDNEQARRAHAVLNLLSPRARKVEGRPRPPETLSAWAASADPAQRAAAVAMRTRLPTWERVARGELEDLLLDPISLAAFDADATGLGRTLMLGASFDAFKALAPLSGPPPAGRGVRSRAASRSSPADGGPSRGWTARG
jgi:GNAT superfamily N-acetyltransferase